ncbi:MAG: peptidoglycan DD-metalloendopeptidase family protein [Clostridia bacterium]|nr:peptidoglycan DD-metalloendopeptidase family protein [Clostridia bacterium]
MNGKKSIFSSVYDVLSEFGSAYFHTILLFFNSVFSRPVRFVLRSLKRFFRMLFRGLVVFFAPSDSNPKYWADDVTRAGKKCIKVLFSHPASVFSVFFYYVKKAFRRYEFRAKNIALWLIPSFLIAGLFVGIGISSDYSLGLRIFCDGEEIGCVADEARFLEAKEELKKNFSYTDKKEFPAFTYSLGIVSSDEFTDSGTLYERLLAKNAGGGVNGCGVYVDGELFAAVLSEAGAREVFDELLENKKSEKKNYTVSFAQEIEFRQGIFSEKDITDTEKLKALLTTGEKQKAEYTVKDGDTLSSVADKFFMTEDRLRELNSLEEDSSFPEAGAELFVEKGKSILSFREVRTEISLESVDYSKIEIESNALYSGSTRVLLSGKDGVDQVTSFVTFIDGEKVSSSEVSRLTVTEAVPERVQVGTKPLDEAYSNSMGGIFLWPIVGAYGINSDYGYRWGKLHAGLDLGMGGAAGTSLGKSIIAVAQGTVIVAGVHSSYGYYVIIDHGNGLQTLYAHCLADSLMVVPGQTVVAGQPIARVGSTGYSTGPHLHFEVRVHGNRVNPRPYLGI